MALNGYRSAEDRATRLVMTSAGFVVAIRKGIQRYEVRKDGEPLGEVHKFKNWFPNEYGKADRDGKCGPACATRQAAIEWLAALASRSEAPEARPNAAGQEQGVGALIFKLECFIDHATGGKLSKSSWALETLKAAHDEHLNSFVDEALAERSASRSEAPEARPNAAGQEPVTK